MFRPESACSRLGKRNFILGWIKSVDSKIAMIDFLGVGCWKLSSTVSERGGMRSRQNAGQSQTDKGVFD